MVLVSVHEPFADEAADITALLWVPSIPSTIYQRFRRLLTTMASDLSLTTGDRLQHLLAQQRETEERQARIQAEIAALLPSATPHASQHQRTPIRKPQQHRSNVSRSMSSNGSTMGRQQSSVGTSSVVPETISNIN